MRKVKKTNSKRKNKQNHVKVQVFLANTCRG